MFGIVNPYCFSTNFGGCFHLNMMPAYYTPYQAFAIQNMFNPFFYYNNMMNNCYQTNPMQNYFNSAAYVQGQQIGDAIGTNVSMQNFSKNITAFKADIEKACESDEISDSYKQQLKETLKEIERKRDWKL